MFRSQESSPSVHSRQRSRDARIHARLLTRPLAAAALGAALVLGTPGVPLRAALPPGTVIQQWNQIAEDTVIGSGAFQNEGLIYIAYVSAAVYDAVVAIEGGYEPYASRIEAAPGASVDAAVVEAAYTTLRFYFADFGGLVANLDARHAEALALLPAGSGTNAGRNVGVAAANAIIALRTNDGRITPVASTSSFPTNAPGPGVWRLTPPFTPPFDKPQTPWVGAVSPFILTGSDQFHPPSPPPLTSQRWVDEFNEVKDLGAATSGSRTPAETATARFWTANVIRQYNRLGRDLALARSLDPMQSARLLAMINVVGADAQISVMHWKYEFLFWRPVTAIDPTAVIADGFGPVDGFEDGNDRTPEEPGWRPLVANVPNHPEYPGAHGSITSAVAEVLTEFLGTDQLNIDIRGTDAGGALNATHHFDTATQLREEIVGARLWAGLHYRGSTEAGIDLGRKVAHYDLNHAFRPVR
jgi:hypothetical protein